ncbi:hypothetical protein TWF569_005068 [Orbilia oligospora]|uniref:Uncharacterized protein n=1 Tax=Orbilia oligospora TaxID=2813651 RepID=A0A7C8JT13_ORBOL|nr:hypothetical protein TWF103_003308 [Orbilia oligospora]KAF3084784.1 hypothetical protein TWF706_000685 [Orbilia oligospora]KAF3093651.1 hypothetical protein TWF102_007866 [Orbilia oligospora]KAF3123815.1 hypothetical protein TWF703_000657 [Orbilia oligospora]KAF3125334.1 hypothetical protein TWF594_001597 [Orbilia oligospora]
MVPWTTLQTAAFLFGPIFIPKLIAIIRSVNVRKTSTRTLDPQTRLSLNILTLTIFLALASSLSYFQSENIIKATESRLLLTPNDVLLRRFENLRLREGLQGLSSTDVVLLNTLKTREGRLLYAAYGPKPLTECAWCSISDPSSYLFYSAPTIAAPHIVNIAVLGLVTSSLSSKIARSFRISAIMAGLGVALGEFVLLYSHDLLQNTQATSTQDINWYHWRLLTYRGLAIATINCMLGVVIYMTATGRYGFSGVSDLEKIEALSKSLDVGVSHVRTSLFVKSTTTRNESNLNDICEFWRTEAANRRNIASQVEDTKNQVLKRVNLNSINDEAFKFTSSLIDAIAATKGPVSNIQSSTELSTS